MQVLFRRLGGMSLFIKNVFLGVFQRPFRWKPLFRELFFVGNESLGIILLTGSFTGAVFALQIGGIFSIFKTEALTGGATAIALASELAPLVTGFLLAGRAGSAMTAELANMVVSEQIDALEAMGLDPIHCLAVPKFLASILMMPLLCGIFLFVGMIGCWLISAALYGVDEGVFWDKVVFLLEPSAVFKGLRKIFIFGGIIALVACRFGLQARGGARGVGVATNGSVVTSLVVMLAADFFISYVELS